MKNTVMCLVFICLLSSGAFCNKASSQLKPADDEPLQTTGNTVDGETTSEDAPENKSEAEKQAVENAVDTEKGLEKTPDKGPAGTSGYDAANLGKLTQAHDGEIPSATRSSSDTTIITGNQSGYRNPFAITSPEPPSGTGYIITGSILLGTGALGVGNSIVIMSLVDSDNVNSKGSTILTAGLITSCVLVAVGIPLLIIGLNRRSDVVEWRKTNGFAGFDLQFDQHKVMTSWSAAF